jgi:hypothetical protein
MLRRSVRPAGYIIAAILAVACDNQPTGSSADDAASLVPAGANLQTATTVSGKAIAVKHGITPSEIQVSVGGQISRYQALVVGTVEKLASGDTVIRRRLVAWSTSGDRTLALLDVTTLANVGSFSSQFEPASDPRARAEGTWIDFVRDSRWVATTGMAELALGALGGPCLSDRIDVRCTKAVYRMSVDGLFRLHGASPNAGLPAVRIQTAMGGVSGVLLVPESGVGAVSGAASLVGSTQRQGVRTPERKGTRRDDSRVTDKRRGDTRRDDSRRDSTRRDDTRRDNARRN